MNTTMKKRLLRGVSAITASLLALMIIATSVATAYEAMINTHMGTSSYEMRSNGDDNIDTNYFKSEFTDVDQLVSTKKELTKAIAEEGCVLLKNADHALPLNAASDTVTLWGLNSTAPLLGGLMGSTATVSANSEQSAYGIIEALQENGFNLNDTMISFYKSSVVDEYRSAAFFFGNEVPGHGLSPSFGLTYDDSNATYPIGEPPASLYPQDVLNSAKDTTAIVLLCRDSSEAADYSTSMTDPNGDSYTVPLALSDYEKQLIELAKANSNGKVIILLNTDMTLEIDELKHDDGIDAILWTGLPGLYGFLGVANVLDGTKSPSGHLVDTFAVSSTSAPAMVNFGVHYYNNYSQASGSPLAGNSQADFYTVQNEGIYVGYKYYETRYEDLVLNRGKADSDKGASAGNAWDYASEVSYPFGYGLSYTTFQQKLEKVNVNIGGTSTAVVGVTNTGDVPGKCAVQLYVQTPYAEGGVEKSAIMLLDFGKTKELQPNESEKLTIEFDARYMASYDENANNPSGTKGAWVLDAGTYYFTVGNGAHESLNNILASKLGSVEKLVTINDGENIDAENVVSIDLSYDANTYSENVENALQESDLNHYIPDAVEYVTRSDWSKGWEPVLNLSATDEMIPLLNNKVYSFTKDEEVSVKWGVPGELTLANMMLFDENGTFIGVRDLDDPLWDSLIQQITLDEAAHFFVNGQLHYEVFPSIASGIVWHYDGPIGYTHEKAPGYAAHWDEENSNEATYVSAESKYAVWSMMEMPTEPVIAATFNKELAEREGELLGEDSLWSNATGVMAPGLNIHRATYCSRNHEYYSEDSMLTNLMGAAFCGGSQSKGMLAEPKHFIMNHQEVNRIGLSTFFTEQAAREGDLRAFQGTLQNNLSGGVMTAFNRLGVTYSGADDGLLNQILRAEWGYTGYVLTDMVTPDYMNWRDVIANGGGVPLTTDRYADAEIGSMKTQDNLRLIAADNYFQERMQETLHYCLYRFANSNAMNGFLPSRTLVSVTPWWKTALYVAEGTLGLLTVAAFAGYALTATKKKETGR